MEAELAQVGRENRIERVVKELALAGVVLRVRGDWRLKRVLDVSAVGAHAEEQAVFEEAAAKDGIHAEERIGERRVVGGSAFEVEVFDGAQARSGGLAGVSGCASSVEA